MIEGMRHACGGVHHPPCHLSKVDQLLFNWRNKNVNKRNYYKE